MTDARHRVIKIAHLEHFVLRWAKNVDNKIKAAQMMKFVLVWLENIVGQGENAAYQHFLHFSQCFQKLSFTGLLKVRFMWCRVKQHGYLYNVSVVQYWKHLNL